MLIVKNGVTCTILGVCPCFWCVGRLFAVHCTEFSSLGVPVGVTFVLREKTSVLKNTSIFRILKGKKSFHAVDFSEVVPPAPLVTRFLNTRAMKETFKSYMELLVSIALDPDTMQALEKSNGTVCLTLVCSC